MIASSYNYSVPHALVGRKVDLRHTATTVEVFHQGQRVAAHAKVSARGRFTTVEAHMPTAHRNARWSPERLLRWAEKTGPHTAAFVTAVLHSRRHPEQGFRTCLGVLRLCERYTPARLEAACHRALALKALSYRSVDSILAHGLDRQPLAPAATTPSQDHANLRGPTYFH